MFKVKLGNYGVAKVDVSRVNGAGREVPFKNVWISFGCDVCKRFLPAIGSEHCGGGYYNECNPTDICRQCLNDIFDEYDRQSAG